jgi:hypothetical protein
MRYIWNQHGRGEIHSERCAPRSPPALALRVALRLERLAPSALATLWILTATAEALASAELMTLRTLVALAVELGSTLHTLVTEDTGERRSGANVRRNKTCTGARVTVLFERRAHRYDFGNRAHASVCNSASDGSGHTTVTGSSILRAWHQQTARHCAAKTLTRRCVQQARRRGRGGRRRRNAWQSQCSGKRIRL